MHGFDEVWYDCTPAMIHQSRGSLVCLFKQVGSAVRTWLYKHVASVLVALGRGAAWIYSRAHGLLVTWICSQTRGVLSPTWLRGFTRKHARWSTTRSSVDLLADVLAARKRSAFYTTLARSWIFSLCGRAQRFRRHAVHRGFYLLVHGVLGGFYR